VARGFFRRTGDVGFPQVVTNQVWHAAWMTAQATEEKTVKNKEV